MHSDGHSLAKPDVDSEVEMPQNTSTDRTPKVGPFQKIVQSCPITSVILAPYAALVIPIGLINGNPDLDFVVGILTIALFSSLAVELILLQARPAQGWMRSVVGIHKQHPKLFKIARAVALVSIISDLAFATLGGGTIFTQVKGLFPSSAVVQVAGVFDGWTAAAFALLVGSFLGGHASKPQVFRWVAALIGTQVLVATMTAITNPLFGLVIFVAVFGVIFGLFGMRTVLVLGIVLIIVWPTVFEVRNSLRSEGGVDVSSRVSAYDRLRFDLQVSNASQVRGSGRCRPTRRRRDAQIWVDTQSFGFRSSWPFDW